MPRKGDSELSRLRGSLAESLEQTLQGLGTPKLGASWFGSPASICMCNCYCAVKFDFIKAEPVEGPPAPPGRGGLTYVQGPHVTYEKNFSSFFNVFKIF